MGCKQPKLKQFSSHAYQNQPKKDNSALLIQGPQNTWFLKIFPFEHDYMKTKKKFLLHIYMRPTVNFEYNGTLNNTQL